MAASEEEEPSRQHLVEYRRILECEGPTAAVAYARQPRAAEVHPAMYAQVLAGALTDCGAELVSAEMVAEGLRMWRELRVTLNDPRVDYNVANALFGSWSLRSRASSSFDAWEVGHAELREARTTYLRIMSDAGARAELRVQAAVNLANSYDELGRTVEAVDMYDRALAISPRFGMALGNRGMALMRLARTTRTHRAALWREAYWNLHDALESDEDVLRFGGLGARDRFAKELTRWESAPTDRRSGTRVFPDAFGRWCEANKLFLHFSQRCATARSRDPLYFESFHEPIDVVPTHSSSLPPMFGAFNVLKQEYVTARLLTWLSLVDGREARSMGRYGRGVSYIDTLDHANHDVQTGLGKQAFQCGVNLLDKIGSTLDLYLGMQRPKQYFIDWWKLNKNKAPESLHNTVKSELDARNVGILALCDLTEDLVDSGRYFDLEQLRHAATHRTVVVHSEVEGSITMRLRDNVVRVGAHQFERLLLDQLTVARSALSYLVQAIDLREARRAATSAGAGTPLVAIPAKRLRN